jgi:hypothetical protein
MVLLCTAERKIYTGLDGGYWTTVSYILFHTVFPREKIFTGLWMLDDDGDNK